jgi:hypothetical protein
VASARSSGNGEKDIQVHVDAEQLRSLARDLREVGKEAVKEMRIALRQAAEPIKEQARTNAAEYSRSVARSITVETPANNTKAGVFISASRRKMKAGHEPFPALLELGSKGGSGVIRHPVFGNTSTWVNQPTHPYLARALASHQNRVYDAIAEAIDRLTAKHGL